MANFKYSKHRVEQYETDILSEKIASQVIEKKIKKLQVNLQKLEAEKNRFMAKQDSLKAELGNYLIDLESSVIKSPIDGIIANRIVEPGVYMKKGWPLMSVVPTKEVWIIANFKETQIKNIQVGQKADIIIDAQPPGKRNTSLRLLSSGEKALTAISLLFSIYQVKPSPYCILDEVDAPLDDVNIHKFTKVLKQFADETQFIIVTHNKLTMEIANHMYGVTQEKKGVSKLVSVSFE